MLRETRTPLKPSSGQSPSTENYDLKKKHIKKRGDTNPFYERQGGLGRVLTPRRSLGGKVSSWLGGLVARGARVEG
jgi:hypothetical protein